METKITSRAEMSEAVKADLMHKYSIGETISSTVGYVRNLMGERPRTAAGKGVEMGVHALIGRTALRRLPAPLNIVVPLVVEKVILKHGAEEGREVLLKGLRWIKKVTDDDPVR